MILSDEKRQILHEKFDKAIDEAIPDQNNFIFLSLIQINTDQRDTILFRIAVEGENPLLKSFIGKRLMKLRQWGYDFISKRRKHTS